MSFKRNVLFNYASQIYVTLVGMFLVPTYLRYMGTEAYGLVGFFTMLQAWFQLLDVGLSPMLSRETARFNAGAVSAQDFRKLLRILEFIFVGIAVCGFAVLVTNAHEIATRWLNVEHISRNEVAVSIMLMSATIVLRWTGGLYRGVVTGFEKFAWLSGFNTLIATTKFVLVVPVLVFVSAAPKMFFGYQLAIALVETGVLIWKTYSLLPSRIAEMSGKEQSVYVSAVIKFSLSIAFTNAVWVFLTQTDKLILSKLLPLSDYAYFTLAVVVANGVNIIGTPLSSTLLPRMAKIAAVNDDHALFLLYGKATQMVTVIVFPVAIMLALFSKQIIWAWTGDVTIASHAAPILSLYAVGNGILALAAFPYYLQYAKGNLRLHLLGSLVFVVALIPALLVLVRNFGAAGAGYAWLGLNVSYLLLWVPMVHRRFSRGLHLRWLLRDIGVPLLTTIVSATLIRMLPIDGLTRSWTWGVLILMGMIVLFMTAMSSSHARRIVQRKVFGSFQTQ